MIMIQKVDPDQDHRGKEEIDTTTKKEGAQMNLVKVEVTQIQSITIIKELHINLVVAEVEIRLTSHH